MQVVLFEPEIPPNTGNIARLCVATNTKLHLVGHLGFSLEDKYLRRAGLDYWEHLNLSYHKSLEDLWKTASPTSQIFYISKKGGRAYTEAHYKWGDYLVFGSETRGLPEELIQTNKHSTFSIPMFGPARCLNLSNAVAIVLYEALRQAKRF